METLKTRLKLFIFLLAISSAPGGPPLVQANLDESCSPVQTLIAPSLATPHHHTNTYGHNYGQQQQPPAAAALQNTPPTNPATPLESPSTWGETVVCQIRTLHSELDLENLTRSNSHSSVPIDWSSVSKLLLRCNDVLFFESSLSSQQLSLYENLHELIIEKCKLKSLGAGVLSNLRHLRKLTINTGNSDWASRSLELSPNLFQDLNQLRHLNLGFNHMWNLPENLLCQAPLLQSVNLTRNLLGDLEDLGLPPSKSHVKSPTPCLSELRSLDLSHNLLRSFGRARLERLKRLQELHLDHNWLEELHDDALNGLSQLRTLNLSSNRLVALPPKLFSNAKLLRELDLHNNSLTSLTSELLEPLEHLQVLDVSENSLVITDQPFKGLVRLVILNLRQNSLASLAPSTFKDLYTLQVLDLSSNQISTIDPETFMSISNLHSLNLARNRLRVISAHMFDGLYVLHKLILDYNQITSMDQDSLKNCTSLQDLGLVGNQFTTIPAALKSLSSLRTLDLGENRISILFNTSFNGLGQLYGLRLVDNQIQGLPRGLCEPLSRLKVFNIAQNKIAKISSTAFAGCPDLKLLRLDSNQLSNFPSGFSQLPNLLWLNVSTNKLGKLEYSQLPPTLGYLDISHNQVATIGSGARGAPRSMLRVIEASFNLVTSLDSSAITPTLEILQLNYNKLEKINVETLNKAFNLSRVEMVGNQLETIPLAALRFPPYPENKSLPEFFLGGNPFLCDCDMEWLTRIQYLATLRSHPVVSDLDSIICRLSYSRTSSHMSVAEMKAHDFLCPYKSHCFHLCHCCDFDACDCAMTCPSNCTCYHDDTWTGNVIDCALSSQVGIPARLPMDSTEVYLDGNKIPLLKSHALIGRKNLKALYLNSSGIETISNKSFNGLQSLQILHLERNLLKTLQGFEFDHLARLRELYLQENKLSAISNTTFLTLKSLEILRLDGNLLKVFTVWQLGLNPYLVEISLGRNPWDCDCQFLNQFHGWVKDNSRKIIDARELRCTWNESRTVGPYIKDFDNGTCGSGWAMIQGAGLSWSLLPLWVGLVMTILIFVAMVILTVFFHEKLCFCVYKRWGWRWARGSAHRPDGPDGGECDEKCFDAYLIYSQKDEALVNEKLAEELETHDNYRLCLHHRDLVNEAGDLKGMMWGALESAKSLVVLVSGNFFQEWSTGQGSVLYSVMSRAEKIKKPVIIIKCEDITEKSPEFESVRTGGKIKILQLDNSNKNNKKFWKKLKFYLPVPSSSSYHVNITTNTTTVSEPIKFEGPPDAKGSTGWNYSGFVALPPNYQMPKSPPSNCTDSTAIDQNSDASGSGTSSSYYSHGALPLPKSPVPPRTPFNYHVGAGNGKMPESYLSAEGEHVYSSLDPPSPQHSQGFLNGGTFLNSVSSGGNHGNGIGNHMNISGNRGTNGGNHSSASNHGNIIGHHGNSIGNHGNNPPNHGNIIGNHGNNMGNHGNNTPNHGNSINNHGNIMGNHSNSMGKTSVGHHSNQNTFSSHGSLNPLGNHSNSDLRSGGNFLPHGNQSSDLRSHGSNNATGNLKSIHLPNGYTYSPSPRPQPQWHPHPGSGAGTSASSNSGTRNKSSKNNKSNGESVQTYLV